MSKKQKPYWEMNADELAEATAAFDKPVPASRMRPLSKKEREDFESSRRKGVRNAFMRRQPAKVTLELSEDLLTRSVAYASKHRLTLSEVVERSLRNALSFAK